MLSPPKAAVHFCDDKAPNKINPTPIVQLTTVLAPKVCLLGLGNLMFTPNKSFNFYSLH